MSDATFYPIDDRDPNISYIGSWSRTAASSQAWNGTVTFSTSPNDTIRYQFDGIQIVVFGSVLPLKDDALVAAMFSVDASSATYYSYPKVAQTTNQVVFFLSPLLSNGLHEIEITIIAASQDNAFIFDYFGIIPQSFKPSGSYLTSSIATPTSTVVVTKEVFRESKVPLGPIIGGVLGGLALLLVALFAAWFLLRRHRRGQAYFYRKAGVAEMLEDEIKLTDLPDTIEPYTQAEPSTPTLSHSPTSSSTSPAVANFSRTRSALSSGSQSSVRTTSLPITNPDLRPLPSSNQPHSKTAEAGFLATPKRTTYHSDSGYRYSSAGEPSGSGSGLPDSSHLGDVPPEYSET